jgi:hypothetical protein
VRRCYVFTQKGLAAPLPFSAEGANLGQNYGRRKGGN